MKRLGVETVLRLDRRLLEEAGLGKMSASEQRFFLQYCFQVLELRVGMAIAGRLVPSQLEEFERFVEGDLEFAEAVLDFFEDGWRNSDSFQRQIEGMLERDGLSIREAVCHSAGLAWLEDVRPDYRDVVRAHFEVLRDEIELSAAEILEAAG